MSSLQLFGEVAVSLTHGSLTPLSLAVGKFKKKKKKKKERNNQFTYLTKLQNEYRKDGSRMTESPRDLSLACLAAASTLRDIGFPQRQRFLWVPVRSACPP